VADRFRGTISVDIRDSVPDWRAYTQPIAPEAAPNVLNIVLDDVGFSALEPFGGMIETPNINRIAERQAESVDTTTCHIGFRCAIRRPDG
jgi:arylsulfatase